MNDQRGDVAVVTGAAGGMGRAIAQAFADEGRPLVLSDLHAEPLEALAESLRRTTPVVAVVAGDVTDAQYPASLIAAVGGRRVGVLAHAAGVSPTMADGRKILAINFTATVRLTEAFLPLMAAGGTAVLIASNSGQLVASPMIDRAVTKMVKGRTSLLVSLMSRHPRLAYPLSKRAVQLYAPIMSPAFGRAGARIVSLSPGVIETDMGRREREAGKEIDKMIAAAALARMGQAHEIAAVVTFLASPAASYITGTDILVDGGTIAGVAQAGGVMRL